MSRVARYHSDRTNQKLYFARLSLSAAEQTSHQEKQCYQESTVSHLYQAVFAFLQELSRYYQLNDLEPTLESLKLKLEQKGQVSPEILVLEALWKTGFLAELKMAYYHCIYTPSPLIPQYEDETASHLIIKVTQTPQAWLPDTAILREWYQEIMTLLEGFRAEMIEF